MTKTETERISGTQCSLTPAHHVQRTIYPSRARLEPSRFPRQTRHHAGDNVDDLAPEDFARDVLIGLMRNAVEELKTTEDVHSNVEALTGTEHRITQEGETARSHIESPECGEAKCYHCVEICRSGYMYHGDSDGQVTWSLPD
ncbi:hypothetical protein BC826DRAFT_460474 [Russula brevipes]|nr:hypothetical protein BC826DRAFT_460474 [Russula brevipes]